MGTDTHRHRLTLNGHRLTLTRADSHTLGYRLTRAQTHTLTGTDSHSGTDIHHRHRLTLTGTD